MDISQRGIDLIKDYESYSGKAYLCPEGVPTIGFGSTRWDAKRPVKMGDTCTVEQAEMLLRKELQRVEDAIDEAIKVPLTQGEFDCLCSFGFNVGTGWINGKRKGGAATLIRYINAGQKEKVPSELLKFKRGANSGKALNGLLNRRKREIKELWLHESEEEEAPVAAPPMPQAVAPEEPSTVKVAAESNTIRAAFVAIAGTIAQAWNWVFSTAKEAGTDAVASQQALTPLEALFKAIGANMPMIAAAVVLGSLVVVIMRRLSRDKA